MKHETIKLAKENIREEKLSTKTNELLTNGLRTEVQ